MSNPSRTRLVMLGTGTPHPDPQRMGPALAVLVDDSPYLVDFGPGIVRRCAAAAQAGITGLAVANLKIAFLTHLHSDHTVGYPDLIFTPWVMRRDAPVHVYGPAGLREMTEHILAAYVMDKELRVCGLEPIDPAGYGAVAHEIRPGRVYEDERVKVDAFLVDHGKWDAYGFRFETPDRLIVISGDTAPTEAVVEACRGCDVLVHEVYSTAGFSRRSAQWQRYHSSMHTSSSALAAIAARVRPRLLVLTHQLYWGTSDEDLLQEVRKGYDGEVVSAKDLDVF